MPFHVPTSFGFAWFNCKRMPHVSKATHKTVVEGRSSSSSNCSSASTSSCSLTDNGNEHGNGRSAGHRHDSGNRSTTSGGAIVGTINKRNAAFVASRKVKSLGKGTFSLKGSVAFAPQRERSSSHQELQSSLQRSLSATSRSASARNQVANAISDENSSKNAIEHFHDSESALPTSQIFHETSAGPSVCASDCASESFQFDRKRSTFMRVADVASTQGALALPTSSSSRGGPIEAVHHQDDQSNKGNIRACDCGLTSNDTSIHGIRKEEQQANYHYASAQHPPSQTDCSKEESWICLDTGVDIYDADGSASVSEDDNNSIIDTRQPGVAPSPIAPDAIQQLTKYAHQIALDESIWTPDNKTRSIVTNLQASSSDPSIPSTSSWETCTFDANIGAMPTDHPGADSVLLWSGNMPHSFYGSDIPAIRVAAMVPMKPEELVDLMVDSSRVKEYNKMSLGRQDIFVLNDDLNLNESSSIDDDSNSCGAAASHMDSRDDKETCTSPVSSTVLSDRKQSPFGRSITKVVRAVAKPPIIRRTLAFVSLLHATELEDKSGYLIVTRAVYNTPADRMVDSGRDENGKAMSTYGVITNEILLGVNLIKRVQDHPDRCIMINVNHVKSPVVPVMIAKRLGVSGAVAFINDIRALCN